MGNETRAAQIGPQGLVLYRKVFNGAIAKLHEALDGATLVPVFNTERYENPKGFCSITITIDGVPGTVRIVGTAAKVYILGTSVRGKSMYSKRIVWPGDESEVAAAITAVASSARTAVKTLEMALATAGHDMTAIAGLVGGVAITAAGNAKDFAAFINRTFSEADSRSENSARANIIVSKAILAVVKKFDGKSGVAKRLLDAILAEMTPQLERLGMTTSANASKDYDKKTQIQIEVKDKDRNLMVSRTLEAKYLAPLDAAKLASTAEMHLNTNRERLAELEKASDPKRKAEAAEGFFQAVTELAEAYNIQPSRLFYELRGYNF